MKHAPSLLQIEDKIVDLQILTECFACDLQACQGRCCYEGSAGAPLTNDEIIELQDELANITPLLPTEGATALQLGVAYRDNDNDWVTQLVDGAQCAFACHEQNTYLCGIEIAHRQGRTCAQKPISCHLYPIRTQKQGVFTLLRLDRWTICAPAFTNGQKLGIRVYQFLQEPLTRAYGATFVEQLHTAAQRLATRKGQKS